MNLQEAITWVLNIKESRSKFEEEWTSMAIDMVTDTNLLKEVHVMARDVLLKCVESDDPQLEMSMALTAAIQFGIIVGQKMYSFDSLEKLEKGKIQ